MKKLLAVLLSLSLLMSLVPLGAITVSAATFSVYIDGIGLADGEYLPNGSSTTTTTQPSGGYAHLSGSTLILYNYSYTGSGMSIGGGADCTSAVYAIGDLTVSLYGDNTFNMNNTADSYAFYTTGALTINEDAVGGNLTINNCTRGINCNDSVTFVGGTTTIAAKDYGIYCNKTFGITKGKLTITAKEQHGIYTKDAMILGGNIAIIAKGSGINASGMYGQSGGIVTIDAVSTGIVSISTFKQTGGELYITSDSNAVSSISDVTFSGGLFDIKSTTVRALVGKNVTFTNMAPKASTTADGSLTDYVAANIANYKRVVTAELGAPTYSVIFYFGGDPLFGMDIEEGKTVEEPAEPAQDCKTFLGWYLGDTKYDFSKPVTKDIVLVATFKENHTYSNACDKSCNVCGNTRSTTHSYKTTTTKATLTKNGKVESKCSVCSYVKSTTVIKYVKTFKLSATSYTYDGKVKTPTITVKDYAGTTLKKGTDYTVTYASGRKNVGKYKVTVKMKGNYTGTKTLYFTINPAKTTVKSLTAGSKKLTVNITKKSAQVTGYQIQYSTSKSFKSYKTKTVSSYKTTKTTLTGLKAKTTYYVRIRTYKTVNGVKYYSGWSEIKYKKTK